MKQLMAPLSYASTIMLLTILYIVSGKIGLLLAIPPGYTTLIWPPSGIALGMLIIHGWRIWPGVLIGAFVLMCSVSGVWAPDTGHVAGKMLIAFGLASGATIQALAGWVFIRRWTGLPLRLHYNKDLLGLFAIGGPLACLAGACIGIATLYAAGELHASALPGNGLIWWAGNVFGIMIFLPLLLVMPGNPNRLAWRNNTVDGLPMMAILILIVPLGLSVYAWETTSRIVYTKNLSEFQSLALESEKALRQRLDSYGNVLLGGAGFFYGSQAVSRLEWRSYVDTLQITKNFPGMSSIGWIKPLQPQDVEGYVQEQRADGALDFTISPQAADIPYDIITYSEPEGDNQQVPGQNIAMMPRMLEVADLTRITGRAAISRQIMLLQNQHETPGFLMLYPVYQAGISATTPAERQNAFRGWIYAHLIVKDLLRGLTDSQGSMLSLKIYDGNKETPQALTYSSDEYAQNTAPLFHVRKQTRIMEQTWLMVWESTPAYEQTRNTSMPLCILMGGIVSTGVLGMFLISMIMRRKEALEWMAGERKYVLPTLTFIILTACAFAAYAVFREQDHGYVRKLAEDETRKIEVMMMSRATDTLQAFRRMAQRWDLAGGTPFVLWQNDAHNYTQQLPGLKIVQWIDSTSNVRWIEPLTGNENVSGHNILSDSEYAPALKDATEKSSPILSPPREFAQGYPGFIVYFPLHVHGVFDGFLAGMFSLPELFGSFISEETQDDYAFSLSYDGKAYITSAALPAIQATAWAVEKNLRIYDQQWVLRLTPTPHLIARHQTSLPIIVLVSGLLLAALAALAVFALRYIPLSLLGWSYLRTSNQKIKEEAIRIATVLNTVLDGVITINDRGTIESINPAGVRILGYAPEEVIGKNVKVLMPEPYHAAHDGYLHNYLTTGEKKVIGIGREVAARRKDGSVFPMELSVNEMYLNNRRMFVGTIRDISERKEMERVKSEFISIVSHELRTPLTSIRGSLGLILGALSADLPEKVKGLIEIAHNNCERLIFLINDILDIDKIASGEMRFDMKEESLAEITWQAIEANEAYAQKFHTYIELEAMDETIKIEVDCSRYIQILSNLLSNASKFSSYGVPVKVNATQTGEHVRISIEDTGPGIPPEFRSRIFGKFSQADSSVTRTKGGTGLGLHITKAMVEHMRGKIGFNTEMGKGSTFWVEFPVTNNEEATPQQPGKNVEGSAKSRTGKAKRVRRPHILHIEDDSDLSNVLAAAMHGKAEISTAATLKEARQLMQQHKFTLIVLDISMPDGSGLTFLEDVKTLTDKPLPVVILSAEAPPGDVYEQVEAVMVKSRMSEAKIVETIMNILEQQQGE
jgi:PAS domain S-box-containing protein